MAEQEAAFAEIEREKEEFAAKLAAMNRESDEAASKEARLKTTPQIRNINQDPSMSGMIKFALNEGDNFIGKKNADFTPAIAI